LLRRVAHLFEVLKKENNLPIADQLPLTISEARKEIMALLNLGNETAPKKDKK